MASAPANAVMTEMLEYEMRCNNRSTSLNSYLVLYETMNEKGDSVVRKTTMVCPTITHVVCRFPSSVKIELLSDAYVSIAPLISPRIGEETDDTAPVVVPNPVPPPVPPAPVAVPDPVPPAIVYAPRRVPLLAGLTLCRQCRHSPFNLEAMGRCTGGGHRFDKDPATKRCEQFEFP